MYSDAIDLIRRKMEEGGMQQVELAGRANISPAQVSRILTHKSKASAENLAAMAQAVGLPPRTILEMAGTLTKTDGEDPITRMAIHIFDSFKYDETKQQALELLEFLAKQEEKDKGDGKRRTGRPARAQSG